MKTTLILLSFRSRKNRKKLQMQKITFLKADSGNLGVWRALGKYRKTGNEIR